MITKQILLDLSTSIQGAISDILVMPYIIPATQLVKMDDMPLERIGISFDGTTQGVNIDTGREFIDETLKVQLFFSTGDKKGDTSLVEQDLNDTVDLLIGWYKDNRDSMPLINTNLYRILLIGKRSISRSANYYEQYIDFRILRSI